MIFSILQFGNHVKKYGLNFQSENDVCYIEMLIYINVYSFLSNALTNSSLSDLFCLFSVASFCLSLVFLTHIVFVSDQR